MYKKFQAKNGLSVVVSPMPQMTSVSLGIWLGVGGRYETEQKSGISHLIEHMLFKGTSTRSAKDLKEAVEGVGGTFNGFTSDEVTCYMVKVPSKYMELGMDILTDMVLKPRFDEDELSREKFVVYEEIKMYRDQPSEHVVDLLGEIMWPGNSLGRPLTGSIANVRSFKRADLIEFKEANYHPGNIAVVAAGKVSPEKVFQCAEKKFAAEKKKKAASFHTPDIKQKKPQMKVLKGDTKQTHIAMGFRILGRDMRERFATKMLNVILGGNMSSRLFEELREKYGLCYDISSAYKRHSDLGEIQIHLGVDTKNTFRAVTAVLDELKKIKDLGVTEDELTRAKKYTKGQFLLAMEGTSSRMLWLGDRLMTYRQIPEVNDILMKIDTVTSRDVQKAADRVFCASGINLAMIGKVSRKTKDSIRAELGNL
ncbi:MAG: pitrilysin family protein [Candidatus Omnitrophota bacterium]